MEFGPITLSFVGSLHCHLSPRNIGITKDIEQSLVCDIYLAQRVLRPFSSALRSEDLCLSLYFLIKIYPIGVMPWPKAAVRLG